MTSTPDTVLLDDLRARLESAKASETSARQRWNQVSNLRLIVAAIAAGLIFWWLRTGESNWGIAAAVVAVVFALSLVWHHKLGMRLSLRTALVTVRTEAIARVHRDWTVLPIPLVNGVDPQHPYAFDLDLLGHGSLLQMIESTQTPTGKANLRTWLLANSPDNAIAFRQEIARDLVSERDWREDLHAMATVTREGNGNPDVLLDWLEETGKRRIGAVHIVAVVLAVITLSAALASLAGLVPFAFVVPLLIVNGMISLFSPGRGRFDEMTLHARALRQYRATLPMIEDIPGTSTSTQSVRTRLTTEGTPASGHLRALDRALALIVPKSSMLWFLLQIVLNWDLIVDLMLIRVARNIHGRARTWIAVIGEVEAIAALAGVADLNPSWTFPNIVPPGSVLQGATLGHPLIPVERMVANDVTVGPSGHVLIVTGSNMAGKSTLLRTIGLNSVLALAGGPVCATSLSVPNQPIWSSVRITDSLEQGVSLFMAELLRLKAIVDAAESGPITYLLDEILHGTNTTERRIAARQVIARLLRTQSIGAVSTHDLELVDQSLAARSTCVHLVDQVNDSGEGPAMSFDYKVRPGLAPTSNALRLLHLVGLGDEPIA